MLIKKVPFKGPVWQMTAPDTDDGELARYGARLRALGAVVDAATPGMLFVADSMLGPRPLERLLTALAARKDCKFVINRGLCPIDACFETTAWGLSCAGRINASPETSLMRFFDAVTGEEPDCERHRVCNGLAEANLSGLFELLRAEVRRSRAVFVSPRAWKITALSKTALLQDITGALFDLGVRTGLTETALYAAPAGLTDRTLESRMICCAEHWSGRIRVEPVAAVPVELKDCRSVHSGFSEAALIYGRRQSINACRTLGFEQITRQIDAGKNGNLSVWRPQLDYDFNLAECLLNALGCDGKPLFSHVSIRKGGRILSAQCAKSRAVLTFADGVLQNADSADSVISGKDSLALTQEEILTLLRVRGLGAGAAKLSIKSVLNGAGDAEINFSGGKPVASVPEKVRPRLP